MNNMKHIHFPPPVADEMVRAILEKRKTVTRRVVKPPVMNTIVTPPLQPADKSGMWAFYGEDRRRRAPYRPEDILYVRETWQHRPIGGYIYKADGENPCAKWRPSIHMPREAAWIFLRVTDVRVERLREITKESAWREGCNPVQFPRLWNSTIKPADHALYGWEANPWVWVIEFERISKEEAMKHDA